MHWEMALWGLFGGFAVEGLDFYRAFKAGTPMPWRDGRARQRRHPVIVLYAAATTVRLTIGGGLALAAAQSAQVTTPLAAVAVGVAAPLIVERLLMSAKLPEHGTWGDPTAGPSPRLDVPAVDLATMELRPEAATER